MTRRSLFDEPQQISPANQERHAEMGDTDELLEKMLTVMRHMIRDKAWCARAIGSNHFGYGRTPVEAMRNALELVEAPKPTTRRQLL